MLIGQFKLGTLLAVTVSGLLLLPGVNVRSHAQAAAAGTAMAVDFAVADNSAAGIGTVQTCLEVPSQGTYTVDVVVANVPGDADTSTPDGMVAAVFTLKSVSGNTINARTLNGPDGTTFADDSILQGGAGIFFPGGATFGAGISDPVPDGDGSHTLLAENESSIDHSGASGSGWFVRLTATAHLAALPVFVPLNLESTVINDALAGEIAHSTLGGTLAVGGASCGDSDADSLGMTQAQAGGGCPTGASPQPRFRDCIEQFAGTNPLDACANTAMAGDEPIDAMPADLNDDQRVNVTDRTRMTMAIFQPYDPRFDLNASNSINVTDRTILVLYLKATGGLSCA